MKVEEVVDSYIITADTICIEPLMYEGNFFSRVHEDGKQKVVSKSPFQIIKHSCKFYGGNYQQCVMHAKKSIGPYHKIPIVVAHDYGQPFVFFPLLSPKSRDNVWISFQKFENCRAERYETILKLHHDFELSVPVSKSVINRQINHSYALRLSYVETMGHLLSPYPRSAAHT